LTAAADITFLTPIAGLVALVVLVPIAAFAVSVARQGRGRSAIGLPAPTARQQSIVLAVVAVPLLLGLAAAGPALRTHVGRRVRTDAQALFVFDTSRSMAASAGTGAETRFDQAQRAAILLRDQAIPEVPSGVASFTTQLIPHLFPTASEAAFNSTVEGSIGVERPPPPFFQFGVSGTSFAPLAGLRNQGYFSPATAHRYAVILTDGESGAFDPNALGQALRLPPVAPAFPGRPIPAAEAPVTFLVVRVGSPSDRIYGPGGAVEAAYRPELHAAANAAALATATHGRAFAYSDLGDASAALRKMTGAGHVSAEGLRTKTLGLAPYVVLVAFVPLGLVILRRNLANV